MFRPRRGSRTIPLVQLALLCAGIVFLICIGLRTITPERTIARALASCAVSGHRTDLSRACLQQATPKLLDRYSAKQVLTVVDATSAPQELYENCHVIAHTIGIELYKQTRDSETALAQCTQQCGGGCVHGVVGAAVMDELGSSYAAEDIEHLSVSEIQAVGKKYCDVSPALCHSIGHILYLSSHSVPISIEGCDTLAASAKNEKCYRGVFMESVGGEDSLFSSTNPVTMQEAGVTYDCTAAPLSARHACFQYLPAYQDNVFEIQKVYDPAVRLRIRIDTCTALTARDRSACFEGIGYSTALWATAPADVAAQRTLCQSLPEKTDRLSCTLGQVSGYVRYVRYEDGMRYCTNIEDADERSLCFTGAFYAMQDNPGDPKIQNVRTLCGALPQPSECLARFDDYTKIKPSMPEYRRGLFGAVDYR